MKSNLALVAQVLFLIGIFVFIFWWMHLWYTAPCEKFKTGILSNGYAPARCIR